MKYQVGGSLPSNDPTYVIRQADEQLYAGLKAGDFCYVLNCRQMGKSSLLQRTSYRLEQEGYACVYLDVSRLGSESTTPLQWYKGIIISLFHELDLAQQVNFKDWWLQQAELSPVQRLHQFVEEVLLVWVEHKRIFILIDEIDSLLSLSFKADDFFVWIRHCYNMRSHSSEFERLGIALFGVASPSDLIADKRRTPFNIGRAIELHGFQLHEAMPLLQGLEAAVSQSEAVLTAIIYWTQGQPFLTQKLCQLVLLAAVENSTGRITLPVGTETFWVEQLVRTRIIQHWESRDEPEHLRTIRDRLLFEEHKAGRLLGLYQQVLQAESAGERESSGGLELKRRGEEFSPPPLEPWVPEPLHPVPTDDSREQAELLLSGLVEKHNGYLRVKNPLYRNVFNAQWVLKQLDNLRPYSQTFNAWVKSGYQDESRLLRGQALRDAQKWAIGKSLSDLDYQFLAAGQECASLQVQMALEASRATEVEARLKQEKKTARLQRWLLLAVLVGAMISTGLGVGTFFQYRKALKSERQARISEVRALVSSSEGLFASNHSLDALVEAIKATRRLQRINEAQPNINEQVKNALGQAVYGADEYNRLSGHKAAILAVDISPDSSVIASASADNTVKLWQRDGTQLITLTGHKAAVRAVDFSRDGNTLVSASDDSTIKIWKRDGTLLKTLKSHTAPIWGVRFSPDGQLIASASMDRTIKLWKRDGTLLRTLKGYKGGVFKVAFSPDSRIFVSASQDNVLKFWRRDGKLLKTIQTSAETTKVAFSPNGQIIATSSGDNTVKLWTRDGTLLKTFPGHTAVVTGVAFSPDGQRVASSSLDKTIKIWQINGSEVATFRGHSAPVWGLAWSPDGSFIASAGTDSVVKLWQSHNPLLSTITAHQIGMYGVDISSDSTTIATAGVGQDNTVKLWDTQGKLLATFLGHKAAVTFVDISPDGKLIASASADSTVKLWKRDGTLVRTFIGHSAMVMSAAFSPQGNILASSSQDGTVKLWKLDGTLLKTLTGGGTNLWRLGFSPDGTRVAVGGGDGTVKLWKLDGILERSFQAHRATVWTVAFSPQGNTLASGSADGTIKLWKLDGTLLKTFTAHRAAVWGISFSPDGQTLASASVDNKVKLWKLDGTQLATLRGHSSAVRAVDFSHNGTFLASVGDDSKIVLWNLPRILKLDALTYGCTLVQDYLRTNQQLQESDRHICHNLP